jgi:hypothetical protein
MGAHATCVSHPQPFWFIKARCAWWDNCWHPGGPGFGYGYTPSPHELRYFTNRGSSGLPVEQCLDQLLTTLNPLVVSCINYWYWDTFRKEYGRGCPSSIITQGDERGSAKLCYKKNLEQAGLLCQGKNWETSATVAYSELRVPNGQHCSTQI